jgi:hypothetical protein
MDVHWYVEQRWRGHIDWLSPAWIQSRDDFDAHLWVDQFEHAGFSTFIFYSKFHDGYCMWPSKYSKIKPERDFLGEIVSEAHNRGMRVVVYYSTVPDRQAAEEHPDWRCVPVPLPKDEFDFPIPYPSCCVNNPGYREYMLGQLREIQETYNTDGFWMDLFQPGAFDAYRGCICQHCKTKYSLLTNGGSLPSTQNSVEFRLWERDYMLELLREIRDIVDADNVRRALTFNGAGVIGGGHPTDASGMNARPGYLDLTRYVDCLSWEEHVSNGVELDYFCRYLRSACKPYEISTHTSTEPQSWTFKGTDLLLLEHMTIQAHGGISSCSLEPTGKGHIPDFYVEQLAEISHYVRELEPYLVKTRPVYDVAMLAGAPMGLSNSWYDPRASGGWATALLERHIPFSWVFRDTNLSAFPLVIFDGEYPLDEELAGELSDYVRNGGSLLVEHNGAAFDRPGGEYLLKEVLGVRCLGETGYEAHFLGQFSPEIGEGLPDGPIMIEGMAYRVQPTTAEVLACFIYPIAPRTSGRQIWSFHNPPQDQVSSDPAITLNRYGQGLAMYVSCPLGLKEIREHHNSQVRKDPPYMATWPHAWPIDIAANLARFMTREPLLQSRLPAGVSVIVNQQEGRHLVHTLNNYIRPEQFYDARRGLLQLAALPIVINEKRIGAVKRALLVPQDQELAIERNNDWIRFVIPELTVHELVVLEH